MINDLNRVLWGESIRRIVCRTLLFVGAALAVHGGAEELTPVATLRSFDRHNSPGLPQSTVSVFVQDNEGVLWLGTYDGLARYDGFEVTEVQPQGSVPAFGFVTDMARRRRGGVYVGGSGGISIFDGETWRLSSLSKSVVSLAEDPENRLWAVDQHGEIWRQVAKTTDGWQRIPVPESLGPAAKVSIGGDGTVWVSSHSAVTRIKDNVPMPLPPFPDSSRSVTALRADDQAGCWVGTRAGKVWHIGPDMDTWTLVGMGPVDGSPILALTEDWQHRLWCADSAGSVAIAIKGGAWTIWGPANGFKSVAGVSALYADREGTIWLGENGHGAQQYFSEAWTHRTDWMGPSGPQSSVVIGGISPTSRGGLLVAVYGLGLWKWENDHLKQFGTADGLVSTVRCAVEPAPNIIWAGTRGGIFESQDEGPFHQVLALPSGLVNNFFASPDHVWYALTTTSGILEKTAQGWIPAEEFNRVIPDLNVKNITWRANGEVWIGTLAGITVIQGKSAKSYSFRDNPAIPTPVQCMLEVGPDEIWVGGTGGIGIWAGGHWRSASRGEALPGRTIYSLTQDPGGTIWASGGSGVGRYRDGHWSLFDSHNGLLNDECNLNGMLVAPDGFVYVSTMGGLARYNPKATEPPRPRLKAFWRQRPDIGSDGIAHLPRGVRSLSLAWSAPWLAPTPVEYRTRVTPLSPNWSAPSTAHNLAFANLSPGLWTVEVEARLAGTGDEGWTVPIASKIQIAPFFWETLWGPVLALLVLFAVLTVFMNRRTRQLRQRQEELQQAVAEAQASVKTLRGMIPICASCKSIRDDRGAWTMMEAYVQRHSEAEFSHGMCPACAKRLFPDIHTTGDS